jgi:ribosomal protein S21
MVSVYLKEKENFESLLRRFKKKVTDERIVTNYRERTYFLKPSQKRRLYEKEKQKKIRKANARRTADAIKEL